MRCLTKESKMKIFMLIATATLVTTGYVGVKIVSKTIDLGATALKSIIIKK